jgi:hypothetical protein
MPTMSCVAAQRRSNPRHRAVRVPWRGLHHTLLHQKVVEGGIEVLGYQKHDAKQKIR